MRRSQPPSSPSWRSVPARRCGHPASGACRVSLLVASSAWPVSPGSVPRRERPRVLSLRPGFSPYHSHADAEGHQLIASRSRGCAGIDQRGWDVLNAGNGDGLSDGGVAIRLAYVSQGGGVWCAWDPQRSWKVCQRQVAVQFYVARLRVDLCAAVNGRTVGDVCCVE